MAGTVFPLPHRRHYAFRWSLLASSDSLSGRRERLQDTQIRFVLSPAQVQRETLRTNDGKQLEDTGEEEVVMQDKIVWLFGHCLHIFHGLVPHLLKFYLKDSRHVFSKFYISDVSILLNSIKELTSPTRINTCEKPKLRPLDVIGRNPLNLFSSPQTTSVFIPFFFFKSKLQIQSWHNWPDQSHQL